MAKSPQVVRYGVPQSNDRGTLKRLRCLISLRLDRRVAIENFRRAQRGSLIRRRQENRCKTFSSKPRTYPRMKSSHSSRSNSILYGFLYVQVLTIRTKDLRKYAYSKRFPKDFYTINRDNENSSRFLPRCSRAAFRKSNARSFFVTFLARAARKVSWSLEWMRVVSGFH